MNSRRFLVALIYAILVFTFQELVFRVCFPLPELSNFDRGLYIPAIGDEPKGYTRNRAYFWQSKLDTEKRFVHRYNRYGFRDQEWTVVKKLKTKRILFIGDSFVENVMSDSTLPQYFAACIADETVEVWNAGMLGTGISRYLRLLSDMTPVFKPDVVVMVIYANDFMYDKIEVPTHYLEPEYYDQWKPRFVELFQQWQTGKSVPFRFAQKPKLFYLAPEELIVDYDSIVESLKQTEHDEVLDAITNREMNPTRFNEYYREEKYLKHYMDLRLPIDYFKYYAERFGFEPIVVFIPSRNQITDNYKVFERQLCPKCKTLESLTQAQYNQNQKRLNSICDSLNVSFLDLSNALRIEEEKGNSMFWNFDGHLNENGTKAVASSITSFYEEQTQ